MSKNNRNSKKYNALTNMSCFTTSKQSDGKHIVRLNFKKKGELNTRSMRLNDINRVYFPDSAYVKQVYLGVEGSKLQTELYNIKRGALQKMHNAPKQLIYSCPQPYKTGLSFHSQTHFFLMAPDLMSACLPYIYQMSVSRNLNPNEPEHYSIRVYALAKKNSGGFVFLSRLDSNPNYANTKHVPHPHLHSFTDDKKTLEAACALPEKVAPVFLSDNVNMSLSENLCYVMQLFNMSGRKYNVNPDLSLKAAAEQLNLMEFKRIKTFSGTEIEHFMKVINYNHEKAKHEFSEEMHKAQTSKITPNLKNNSPYVTPSAATSQASSRSVSEKFKDKSDYLKSASDKKLSTRTMGE